MRVLLKSRQRLLSSVALIISSYSSISFLTTQFTHFFRFDLVLSFIVLDFSIRSFKSYLISGPFSWFGCCCCFFCTIVHCAWYLCTYSPFNWNFIQNWYRPYFSSDTLHTTHPYNLMCVCVFFSSSFHLLHFIPIRNSIMFFSWHCSKMYDLRFIKPDAIWRSENNNACSSVSSTVRFCSHALCLHIY